MPNNLELKARLGSVEDARGDADRCGARFVGTLVQTDTYFNIPVGRLKLRENPGSHSELIYYRRDEATPERWSMYETVAVDNPLALKTLLEHAYGIRAVVSKVRLHYQYGACRIHIDTVDGLGTFLEFEVQDLPPHEADDLMRAMREAFRVDPEAVIQASYEDLISQKLSGFES